MEQYLPYIRWINTQHEEMVALLTSWANINSGSENLAGLQRMFHALQAAFLSLGAETMEIPLPAYTRIDAKGERTEVPVGDALFLSKRPNAPIKVFLGGHMDTVYPATSPFQTAYLIDNNTLCGPGVADMKGGLVIMLKVLQALERSPFASNIGWEVLINPDEEIGSASSRHLLVQSAQRNHIGLVFEPPFPDGALVSSRKGSANFTIVAKGRAAHAGRDFQRGRNAITAIAGFLLEAEALNNIAKGITVNIGQIEGGGPTNIVPDLAICRLNVRTTEVKDAKTVTEKLREIVKSKQGDGITMVMHEHGERPPKPFDLKHQSLFESMRTCADDLNLALRWNPTGGVCDGNLLAAEGLPTIDTLGPIGGNIHTYEEYVTLNSLTKRAALVTFCLLKLANGDIPKELF